MEQSNFEEGTSRHVPATPLRDPWISLLVLQPSPFCNINCSYCYLPNRSSNQKMSMEIVEAAIHRVLQGGLIRDELNIIWHAGEPLAVPINWYRSAFEVIQRTIPKQIPVHHAIQSNGLLLSDTWCEFIREHHISIGLSIDGPANLHDIHRRTRDGRGTHALAIRGLKLLQKHGIPFHIISVITRNSLEKADEIYEYFTSLGVTQIGFNIEETEGENTVSSLETSTEEAIQEFMKRLFFLEKQSGYTLSIREFELARNKILEMPSMLDWEFPYYNEQVRPLGIVSVASDGTFSTYSPELLGMPTPPYGTFSFGNVLTDSFSAMVETPTFQKAFNDICTGLRLCRESCAYYGFCGGGAPANKYYENKTLASAETRYCRHSIQVPLEIVLKEMEQNWPS